MELWNGSVSTDLWDGLARETRDIWLYGMGNGADKILAVAEKKGVCIKGVFASDGFVRGQSFHGFGVRAFSEIEALYPPKGCVVLLAFGSARPEVLELFDRAEAHFDLFVPDVPVCGEELFDCAYFHAHRTELAAARALFSDEESKRLFDLILRYKLSGRLCYLKEAVRQEDRTWGVDKTQTMVDLGAYNGDSVRQMAACAKLSAVIAAEPDRRNFKKLCDYAKTAPFPIFCHNVAVCDTAGEAIFDASGNRNAGLCTGRGKDTVKTAPPDELIDGAAVDYIKYDVEGAEHAALLGTRQTILRCHPTLKIACYHRSCDLFDLPLLLHSIAPNYRLYLTRAQGVPAWDIDLWAVRK